MKKKDKYMLTKVQLSLFEKFRKKCEEEYKSMSEVIRNFMKEYIKEKK